MFQDAFVRLDPDESQAALALVGPHVQGARFNPETAVVMAQNVSFYPGYRFLDIAEYESVPPLRRFVIQKGDDVTVLNWTNEPIYLLNERAPVRLTEETIGDYVRFFFTYVRGRHGRFLITETVDDINWREEPPPAARKAIGNMLTPLAIESTDGDGNVVLNCSVMFKDALFRARVVVNESGLVNLADEELLIEEMPVLDDTFAQ